MKQRSWKKALVVAGAGVLLVVLASHAVAATSGASAAATGTTIVDPFSLQTIAVASEPSGEQGGSFSLRPSRVAIRFPSRPPARSAFRPIY